MAKKKSKKAIRRGSINGKFVLRKYSGRKGTDHTGPRKTCN